MTHADLINMVVLLVKQPTYRNYEVDREFANSGYMSVATMEKYQDIKIKDLWGQIDVYDHTIVSIGFHD